MHQIRVHLQFLGEDRLLYFTLTFNCKRLTPRPSCCERPTVQSSSVWTGSRSWWGFWRQGRGSVGGGAAGGGKQKLEGDHFCAQVHSADTWLGEEEGPALRPVEPLVAGSLGGRAPAPLDDSLEPKDNKSQHPKYSQNSRMDANCYECSVRWISFKRRVPIISPGIEIPNLKTWLCTFMLFGTRWILLIHKCIHFCFPLRVLLGHSKPPFQPGPSQTGLDENCWSIDSCNVQMYCVTSLT